MRSRKNLKKVTTFLLIVFWLFSAKADESVAMIASLQGSAITTSSC